jgi:hypothetical protein
MAWMRPMSRAASLEWWPIDAAARNGSMLVRAGHGHGAGTLER